MVYALVAGYIVCSVLAYGLTFADVQAAWPRIAVEKYREDMGFAMMIGLTGPIGLVISFLMSGLGQHGLKFR